MSYDIVATVAFVALVLAMVGCAVYGVLHGLLGVV